MLSLTFYFIPQNILFSKQPYITIPSCLYKWRMSPQGSSQIKLSTKNLWKGVHEYCKLLEAYACLRCSALLPSPLIC